MYHVSTQGVDERMINVHYYYYYYRIKILQVDSRLQQFKQPRSNPHWLRVSLEIKLGRDNFLSYCIPAMKAAVFCLGVLSYSEWIAQQRSLAD